MVLCAEPKRLVWVKSHSHKVDWCLQYRKEFSRPRSLQHSQYSWFSWIQGLNTMLWFFFLKAQYIMFIIPPLVAQTVKHLPTMWETWVQSLGQEGLLEKEMETHSSIFAWKIPWTEEPGRLQSMKSQRVGHDWATSLSFFLSSILA